MQYVMSDIHGNLENFESVLAQISLRPDDTLYILGDVIDRHPAGIRILRRIMEMPNVKMLLGNHEWMMLRALDAPYPGDDVSGESLSDRRELWYVNGGRPTHTSWLFGTSKKEKTGRLDYLHSLPLNIEAGDYKLVHAAPTELYEEYGRGGHGSALEFAVWERDILKDPPDIGRTVIFGHTPVSYLTDAYGALSPVSIGGEHPWIGIDCGSGFPAHHPLYRGRLACLRLDDMQVFYAENGKGEHVI